MEHVRSLLLDRCGSHLIEALVAAPGLAWWKLLHAHALKGELVQMGHHATANYTLQVFALP